MAVTAVIIAVWLLVLLVGGRMFSQLNDLGTNDRVQFLPNSAESTQVNEVQNDFREQGFTYAVAVFAFDEPLDDHAAPLIERAVQRVGAIDGVFIFNATPLIVAEDRLAAEMVIPLDSAGELDESVAGLRAGLQTAVPEAAPCTSRARPGSPPTSSPPSRASTGCSCWSRSAPSS
nr:hypothetical protein GCM10025699_31100 [Microbacterium flavescens]